MGSSLGAFLAALAIDPHALSEFIADPDACMERFGVGVADRELIRSGDAPALAAGLAREDRSEAGASADGAATPSGDRIERRGSLVVVGTGIKSVGQLTVEAIAHIRVADRLFYLVAEPLAERAIAALNPRAQSLASLYGAGKARRDTYREMGERILASVRAGWNTCAVFYGHPGVFVDPAHAAIRQARTEGFEAALLPGVSSEDCLFADLGVDPAAAGCQSYEATDFLVNRRQIDLTSNVVIWQPGVLGDRTFNWTVRESSPFDLLVRRLLESYPPEHQACIYQAAVLPGCKATVNWVPIGSLNRSQLSIISTLFIPPSQVPRFDLGLYFALAGPGRPD
jgi:uncharacterized protein YabN with tetrapyrrole methylase and pyrophosphatase domain